MSNFRQTQQVFADHLRNPRVHAPPEGIEDRRLAIYRDLIYNNIEGFIKSGFPVLRSIYSDDRWHSLVQDFIYRHQSHTPYFLQISHEFLTYLQEERSQEGRQADGDPPFLMELAHYEWVELALDTSPEMLPFPQELEEDVILDACLQVSPLAWRLSYQYPVHRLGPDYQPQEPPDQPTFLVVYRNRSDKVNFMETNAVTNRLLQLLEGNLENNLKNHKMTGLEALEQVAEELASTDVPALINHGRDLLIKLWRQEILV